MSATSIFVDGRLVSVPGSYTEVDASGLESVGAGASGIVAILGTSIGGKPYTQVGESVADDLQIATDPQQPRDWFRSGDLREAADMAFAPAKDPDIPGGAQQVVFVKVNPAAASVARFSNADGEALVLTSRDYGNFTTQIAVQIGTGAGGIGKLLTLAFEDTTETFDNVGGDTIATLTYAASTPAEGFTSVTAEVTSSTLKTMFTRDQTGLDGDISNQVTAGNVIELLSSSSADTAVRARVYGIDGSNAVQTEVVTLNGTTVVQTSSSWNSIHGIEIVSGTLAGTLTVRNASGGSTIATIAAAGTEAAIEFTIDHAVTGAVTVVADGATTARVTLFGLAASGVFQAETLTLNGTTAVTGTSMWSRIDGLALGDLAAARTLTVSGTSVNAPFTSYPTIQKLYDKFNATPGYAFAIPTITNASSFLSEDLDLAAASSVKSPTVKSFSADLQRIIAKLNSESQLVTAAKGSVASGAPDNTTAPVYLAGGHEGSSVSGQEGVITATATDWQNAINLLSQIRVNTIVPLTHDPSIHSACAVHCVHMNGIGRSERDMIVGLQNTAQDGLPSKSEIKSQIVALNTRNARAIAQTIDRYNTSGSKETFDPKFAAVVLAGMQAGSPVGTSLTHKYTNTLRVAQHSSWNPKDDAEEMIQAGLVMIETINGIGRRVVRNVTTHLSSSNLVYTQAHVNEALNYFTFNFRTAMERMVSKRGFAGTAEAAKGLAISAAGDQVGISIVAWRALNVKFNLDVIEVSIEVAPVISVNFVKSTIHVVSVPQSA